MRRRRQHGGCALDVLIHEHLAHLRRLNRRPGTIYQRQRWLIRLDEALEPVALIEATTDQLRAFTERHTGAASRKCAVNHLAGFYRWLATEELRLDDPTLRVERPWVPAGLPRPMADEHVAHALNCSPDRLRPWFHLAAYAGLRACEIAPLRREDLRPRTILIREQKGGEPGTVPRSPLLDVVLAGLPRRGWLFPKLGVGWGDDHVTASQVSTLTNRWLHAEGIADTFHSLRHWFGTMTYRVDHDLLATQKGLRHRKLTSTQVYTQIEDEHLYATIAALPNLVQDQAAA